MVNRAIGIHVVIDSVNVQEWLASQEAETKAEVAISIDGMQYEMAIAELKQRLSK